MALLSSGSDGRQGGGFPRRVGEDTASLLQSVLGHTAHPSSCEGSHVRKVWLEALEAICRTHQSRFEAFEGRLASVETSFEGQQSLVVLLAVAATAWSRTGLQSSRTRLTRPRGGRSDGVLARGGSQLPIRTHGGVVRSPRGMVHDGLCEA